MLCWIAGFLASEFGTTSSHVGFKMALHKLKLFFPVRVRQRQEADLPALHYGSIEIHHALQKLKVPGPKVFSLSFCSR